MKYPRYWTFNIKRWNKIKIETSECCFFEINAIQNYFLSTSQVSTNCKFKNKQFLCELSEKNTIQMAIQKNTQESLKSTLKQIPFKIILSTIPITDLAQNK